MGMVLATVHLHIHMEDTTLRMEEAPKEYGEAEKQENPIQKEKSNNHQVCGYCRVHNVSGIQYTGVLESSQKNR